MDAAVIPLPREETTPPVTKMYFVLTRSPLSLPTHAGIGVAEVVFGIDPWGRLFGEQRHPVTHSVSQWSHLFQALGLFCRYRFRGHPPEKGVSGVAVDPHM